MKNEDSELQFDHEWVPADGVRAPELRVTWARLGIKLGDESITQVEDSRSGSTRRSIYGSLYPLAEWMTYNWWFLRSHRRLAGLVPQSYAISAGPQGQSRTRQRYLAYHNIRAAGDGFWWPDMAIVPEGGGTRIVWRSDPAQISGRPLRFVGEGDVVVDPQVVERALSDFVQSVVGRLVEQGVRDTPLENEWNAIAAADSEEAAFCAASARLGLDPYADGAELAKDIEIAAGQLSSSLFDDFVDAVTLTKLPSGLAWIGESSELIRSRSATLPNVITDLRAVSPGPDVDPLQPWVTGFAHARRVRERLQVDPTAPVELADLVPIEGLGGGDRGLEALGGYSSGGGSLLVVNDGAPEEGRRFAQARALWHIVRGAEPSDFLLTRARTTHQAAARSFAAELLAPAKGIREQIADEDGDVVFPEDLDRVGRHYGVSPWVVRHQVANQLPTLALSAVT